MRVEFQAEPDPSRERCLGVAARAPANPFYTSAYAEARRALGFRPWILALRQDGALVSACTAFMKAGRLSRALEIPSLPAFENNEDAGVFWNGLRDFCRRRRVSNLLAHSFASARATIPSLSGEIRRRARCEYVLDLQSPGLWDRLSSNHVRNIRRGRNAGVEVRCAADERAYREHATLTEMSLERRRSRGEPVPQHAGAEGVAVMTRCGAADLFQAVLNGTALSSILVLKADRGAYYQSAGTSPEGMACGASHWLVHEVANILRARGNQLFNLGGAGEDPGLKRFKAGFGATMVSLEEAEFLLGRRVLLRLAIGARLLRGAGWRVSTITR
jgi:hypothetical protein